MADSESTSRLMVLLFTDLVDSSRLKVELGDADYVQHLLKPHNDIFRKLLARFPGAEENNYTGDGFLATFRSVSDAVNLALLFQHALHARQWERVEPQTRIGIHIGDTVELPNADSETKLLASHAADMCARLMGLGAGGQTLLTRAAFDSARQYVRSHPLTGDDPLPEIQWLAHGRYLFKGKGEPMEVFEVGAVGLAPLQAPASSEKAKRALSVEEEQTLGWRPGAKLEIPGRSGWVLQEKLGEGGFGEVWLAQQSRMKEQRVFKFCFDADRLRSFKRELTLFRLIQQGLGDRDDMVRLFDVRVDRPPFFLESEYVPLGNLRLWFEARGGVHAVPLETRLKLLADVARAVAAAHSLGIIHKDIKPSNILIVENEDGPPLPKLADFGIGVLTDRALLDQYEVTATGFTESLALGNESSRTGTRLYSPPEAQVGKPASTAGDVYALGVMLYQFATGELSRPLGIGWEADVDDELLREDITACTHRDPSRRLGNAAELAERLETLPARREAHAAQLRAEARLLDVKRRLRRLKIGTVAAALLLTIFTVTGLVVRAQMIAQENKSHAAGLVQSLLSADTGKLPDIIREMEEYHQWVLPRLKEVSDKAEANSPQTMRASLALLSLDPAQVDDDQIDYLHRRLLNAEPRDVLVICNLLEPSNAQLIGKLWAVVESPEQGKESQRLQAAAALAKYDPQSTNWANSQKAVANDLVAVPAVYLLLWMDALRDVRMNLIPQLTVVFRETGRRDVERSLATDILSDYAADQPQLLADLLMDADENQFAVIYPKLQQHPEQALPVLTGEIDRTSPADANDDDRDDDKERKRESLAKRQANAAVALLRLNQPEKVWPLLQHSPDPRVRSYLIHRLSPLGAGAKAIVKRLHEEPDITIRRALLLSLGEFGETEFTPEDRKALLPKVQEMYRNDPDPGLHASSEWLLRTWKQEAWLKQVNDEWAGDHDQREKRLEGIGKSLTKEKETLLPQWYVNTQGQTFVVIPGPVEFVMGSPPTEVGRDEFEPQHKKRIDRTFAIANKSVTLEQYRQFDKGYQLPAVYTRMANLPVVGTTWYHAAAYCNWLSKEEGIPEDHWSYEISGDEPKLKTNYLSLTGYRLPTEAEMEYATRAGALTSRYFGETDELLERYAWYQKNSQEQTWPVGSLKPNDLGFFDVQGNVFTWCQGSWRGYPRGKETSEDAEDALVIERTHVRVLRGGTFGFPASSVRSAYRYNIVPANRNLSVGFRLARTLPPVPVW